MPYWLLLCTTLRFCCLLERGGKARLRRRRGSSNWFVIATRAPDINLLPPSSPAKPDFTAALRTTMAQFLFRVESERIKTEINLATGPGTLLGHLVVR